PPPTSAPPPPPEPRLSSALEAGAELAVVLLTATAGISLLRLFTDGSFLDRVLLGVVVAHGLAWGDRRMRLGLGGAPLLSAAGLFLFLAWAVEPQTLTSSLLPLGKTWHAISTDLTNALDRFNTAVPPTPVTRGFVVASVIGTWACAFLADTAAFRLDATFETVIPSFTVFLFGSVLAYNRNRLSLSALYLASVLLFVLLISVARREESANWLAGRKGPG